MKIGFKTLIEKSKKQLLRAKWSLLVCQTRNFQQSKNAQNNVHKHYWIAIDDCRMLEI